MMLGDCAKMAEQQIWLVKAVEYAATVHAEHFRKGSSVPYVAHLMAVASLVMEAGGDEFEVTAALLHDAPEDRGGRSQLDAIRRQFGTRVASIVEECTDSFDHPKPPWRQRKESFLCRIPSMSPSGTLVVTADKLHNARSILFDYRVLQDSIWSRFRGGREGVLWYYRSVAELLLECDRSSLSLELSDAVERLVALVEFP